MKSNVDKLDVDKVAPDPVDLNKLSDAVDNDVVKKIVYNELLKKVNAIQATNTSNLVKKSDYNKKIGEIEKTA